MGCDELEFFGYLISDKGCKPTSDKVKAVVDFFKLETIVELFRFPELVNFYRRNLPDATRFQEPLDEFLKDFKKNDKRAVPWNARADAAFEQVKQDLANATMLSHPSFDSDIRLVSDASVSSMGGPLEQFLDGE